MAASLQMLRHSTLSPLPNLLSLRPSSGLFSSDKDPSLFCRRRGVQVRGKGNFNGKGIRIGVCRCKLEEPDGRSKGEEAPESLFMKELRRRGITPTSLLEERKTSAFEEELQGKERNQVLQETDAETSYTNKNLTNQREQSMSLNSEGIEGLVPRAKLLLRLGGTFFLGFGPLILITVGAFAALYFYFGPTFVHDGSRSSVALPKYIDPYELLRDERIS